MEPFFPLSLMSEPLFDSGPTTFCIKTATLINSMYSGGSQQPYEQFGDVHVFFSSVESVTPCRVPWIIIYLYKGGDDRIFHDKKV